MNNYNKIILLNYIIYIHIYTLNVNCKLLLINNNHLMSINNKINKINKIIKYTLKQKIIQIIV